MTLLDELKEKLNKIGEQCQDLPIGIAVANTRVKALKALTEFLQEKELWDKVKEHPPAKFLTVAQSSLVPTEITIHLAAPLLRLLRK